MQEPCTDNLWFLTLLEMSILVYLTLDLRCRGFVLISEGQLKNRDRILHETMSASPKQLKWFETELVYCYKHSGLFTNQILTRALRGEKDHSDFGKSCVFSTAKVAACSLRLRKQSEVEQRWKNILPDLEMLQLEDVSLDSMHEVEMIVIDALDNQNRSDMNKGHQQESVAYCALEQMLTIVQEAIYCLQQKSYFDSFASCKSEEEMGKKNQEFGLGKGKGAGSVKKRVFEMSCS